jgi:chemotaxis protein methyltransferase WspC
MHKGPLQLARQLADAGRLQDATLMCHHHLERESDSAQAYYLLGLIADAQGLASAADFYRRALYLDPQHGEALRQMSLLCAKQGDHDRARVFSRRAERAQERD